MAPLTALGPRLSVTFTFLLGLVYLCLIIREFRRYGNAMDKAWRKRVIEWKGTQRNTFGIPPAPPIVYPKKSDDSAKLNPPPPPGRFPWDPPDTIYGPFSQGMRSFIPFSHHRPIGDPETLNYPAQSSPPQMSPIVDAERSVYSSKYIPPLPAWLPQNPPDTLHRSSSRGMRSFIPFSQNRPIDDPETLDYPAQSFPPSNPSCIPHGRMSPIADPERSVYSARNFQQDPPTVDETADYPSQSFPPPSPVRLPQNPSEVPFDAVKIIDLHAEAHISYDRSSFFEIRDIGHITWNRFISDVCRAWDGPCPRFLIDPASSRGTPAVDAAPQDVAARLLALWNVEFFLHRGTQVVLCEEQIDEEPTYLSYAIYLIDLEPSPDNPSAEVHGEQLARRFGKIPAGLEGINLCDPVPPHGDIQKAISRPLRVHFPPSRQPDWTSSPWTTRSPEGPGEDERSSNDGDVHSERVFSLYAQQDMGITRQETTVSTEAPEDNGLLTVPEREISQDERQLNQDPEEYDLNNLAERPNDWRSEYGGSRTLILRNQRPTKSVKDPWIIYDLRFFPDEQTLSFPILRHIYNPSHLSLPATNPPVERMRLYHPLLPWYIDVRQSQPNGVTVEDVIMQVFWELQRQIISMHYYNKELDPDTRLRIAEAFERRTQGNDEERVKGIKRIDYLEDQVVFIGLVRTDEGLWEMKTRRL
ncbi:hypothetical protein C0993_012487 [Termitomyces sp. T159_Od127]|nr:hypothetical protein C0993_012487 [Termitomyces sp. T159_Od127]